jgi:hypothetical protein
VLIDMVPDIPITDASIHVKVELFGVAVPGGARAYRQPACASYEPTSGSPERPHIPAPQPI